jgi:hypothetical protein
MNRMSRVKGGIFAAVLLAAAAAAAQEETPTPAPAGPEQVDSGTVVNYEQGRNIVIRRPDGSQATYPVASNINWPPDLKMYGWANVYFEPLEGGGFHVTRLTTLPPTPTPEPSTATPTVPPSLPSPVPKAPPVTAAARTAPKGAPVKLSMPDAVTVTAYEKGRQLSVRQKDGTSRSYLIDSSSLLPPKLAVNQKVIVETKTVNGKLFVLRVVYPEIVISNVPKSQ